MNIHSIIYVVSSVSMAVISIIVNLVALIRIIHSDEETKVVKLTTIAVFCCSLMTAINYLSALNLILSLN